MTKGADDGKLAINASVIFFRVMMLMIKKAFVSSILWIPDVTFQEPLWSG